MSSPKEFASLTAISSSADVISVVKRGEQDAYVTILFCSGWYDTLPVISKAFGTLCLASTVGFHLGVYNPLWVALDFALVLRKFQIWRLIGNFFFLGPFSPMFGMRLLMIARYGVQLEKGPFDKRTADFLWMMMTTSASALILNLIIPPLKIYFMGGCLCFTLVYLWSREFPTARVNIMGVVSFQGFYLPWALIAVNTMFGNDPIPDILGIVVGHIYYFLAVLHPLNGGRQLLKTPKWLYKLLAKYRIGDPPRSAPVAQPPPPNTGRVFTGRSYRLNRD